MHTTLYVPPYTPFLTLYTFPCVMYSYSCICIYHSILIYTHLHVGMNPDELAANKQLSNYVVQDLNKNPIFPFDDNTFDYVTCVVSVDYLIRPLEVFSEIRRVLRPGKYSVYVLCSICSMCCILHMHV